MEQKRNIKEFNGLFIAKLVFDNFIVGDIRDEADFYEIKSNTKITLDLMLDYLENIKGSEEDKINLIKEALIQLDTNINLKSNEK